VERERGEKRRERREVRLALGPPRPPHTLGHVVGYDQVALRVHTVEVEAVVGVGRVRLHPPHFRPFPVVSVQVFGVMVWGLQGYLAHKKAPPPLGFWCRGWG